MSTIKSSAENLTLNADGANNDIKFQSNGSEVASIDQAGLVSAASIATTGSVGIGTTSPHASAALDITSTSSGLLIHGFISSTVSLPRLPSNKRTEVPEFLAIPPPSYL